MVREFPFDIERELSGASAGRTVTSIVDYSYECSGLGYGLGARGMAYLVSQTSPDVLLRDFHPIVESLGFDEAFAQPINTRSLIWPVVPISVSSKDTFLSSLQFCRADYSHALVVVVVG